MKLLADHADNHDPATAEWMESQGWCREYNCGTNQDLLPMRRGNVACWQTPRDRSVWAFAIVSGRTYMHLTGLLATNRGGVRWVTAAIETAELGPADTAKTCLVCRNPPIDLYRGRADFPTCGSPKCEMKMQGGIDTHEHGANR